MKSIETPPTGNSENTHFSGSIPLAGTIFAKGCEVGSNLRIEFARRRTGANQGANQTPPASVSIRGAHAAVNLGVGKPGGWRTFWKSKPLAPVFSRPDKFFTAPMKPPKLWRGLIGLVIASNPAAKIRPEAGSDWFRMPTISGAVFRFVGTLSFCRKHLRFGGRTASFLARQKT